jgi:threonine synthase
MMICSNCAITYPTDRPRWRCDCGAYLLLNDTAMFTVDALRDRPPTLWRYQEALGIDSPTEAVSLGEGLTPLVPTRICGHPVTFKVDYLCPTGSYKDRGSSVMVSKLREWGVNRIIEDSSGNAGASIAAYATTAGIQADIYIPAGTSEGKGAQIGMYGANLIKVPGTREDTARAAWDAAGHVFYASHNWSPYFLAGMKTAAYEIAEQMSWEVPDWVITPTGGGGLLVGLFMGFAQLFAAHVIRRIPRLVAAQSSLCDPIHRAWFAGLSDVPAIEKQPTVAEGISVARPVRGKTILQAIRESRGSVRTVSDHEVWEMLPQLGRVGMYVEPTAAIGPAAFVSLREDGTIADGETAVVMLTGSGLKATDKIVEHFGCKSATTV